MNFNIQFYLASTHTHTKRHTKRERKSDCMTKCHLQEFHSDSSVQCKTFNNYTLRTSFRWFVCLCELKCESNWCALNIWCPHYLVRANLSANDSIDAFYVARLRLIKLHCAQFKMISIKLMKTKQTKQTHIHTHGYTPSDSTLVHSVNLLH